MNKLKGIFINLDESTSRRTDIETQLMKLGLSNQYRRFKAIRGDKKEAKDRRLSGGELGLWRSWIKLLEDELANDETYEYLHIAEDDIVLSPVFKKFADKIGEFEDADMITTDMYVNPSIHKVWSKQHAEYLDKQILGLSLCEYTGCTTSMILPRNKIRKILGLLTEEMKKESKLIPIDNYFVRLNQNQKVKIAKTVPFITSVKYESFEESTIQLNKSVDRRVQLTQELCYYLRKHLSIFYKPEDRFEIERVVNQLIDMSDVVESKIKMNTFLTKTLEAVEINKILLYKDKPNLRGEPLNDQ